MAELNKAAEPRLIRALREIASWRDAAEADAAGRLREINAEEQRITEAIAELQAQLDAARAQRDEVNHTLADLDPEELRRSHKAVVESLNEDRTLLTERAAAYSEAVAASMARAEEMLADEELQRSLTEYEAFADSEASLAALPSSYREAIQAHHEKVKARLGPLFAELEGRTVELDLPPATLSLVASVSPAEGTPDALVMVMPVEAAFYDTWDRREQDISACMAYRMMTAAVEIATRVGAAEALIRHQAFEGHVTIWVWLGDSHVQGDLREVTREVIDGMRTRARELQIASLDVHTMWLPPEVLQVPDEVSEDDTSDTGLSATPTMPDQEEAVGDEITEDEEIPSAVVEDDIPDFYIEPEA
ncbi:MAG: hypothetical protein H6739_27010 [Alphaproteobacteria bacterium]|nr:hypothetical protein [Alphaproteobacteria bacterium]